MKSIVVIALNTFREAVRNRILYIILFFSLIMIAFSGVAGTLAVDARDKVVKDLGFTAINLFGVAMAVFLGVSLVYNEIERKSIYTIVSKPIDRRQFLLGKYFGLLLTVYVNVALMSVFYLLNLHFLSMSEELDRSFLSRVGTTFGRTLSDLALVGDHAATRNVLPVVLVTTVELAMVTAFAVLYSSFSTPFLSMIFTVLTFLAGRSNEDIVVFSENLYRQAAKAGEALPLSYYLAVCASHVTPNLGIFHRTVEQVVHTGEFSIWYEAWIYAPLYTAGILVLAMLIFDRRNFK